MGLESASFHFSALLKRCFSIVTSLLMVAGAVARMRRLQSGQRSESFSRLDLPAHEHAVLRSSRYFSILNTVISERCCAPKAALSGMAQIFCRSYELGRLCPWYQFK